MVDMPVIVTLLIGWRPLGLVQAELVLVRQSSMRASSYWIFPQPMAEDQKQVAEAGEGEVAERTVADQLPGSLPGVKVNSAKSARAALC
jgi:hypothetical protein